MNVSSRHQPSNVIEAHSKKPRKTANSKKTAKTDIQFNVFIRGRLIDLVVLNEEVVEKTKWYKWFNDEELTFWMQKHYFPNTKSMQLEFLKRNIENSKTKLQCGIVHKQDNVMIGTLSLSHIDHLHRKCEIGGIIGEKKYQRLKYIIEAFQLFIRHAFEQLNMNKVYGGSITKEVSDMMVRILGFKLEGIKRSEIYKNGRYYDGFLLGLLRDEYYAQRNSD